MRAGTALDTVYARHLPHERRSGVPGPLRTRSWSAELRRGGWFGNVAVELVHWQQQLTAERARLLWSTFPNVASLPPPRRRAFLDELAGLVDDLGGSVEDPRVTVIYRTRPAG